MKIKSGWLTSLILVAATMVFGASLAQTGSNTLVLATEGSPPTFDPLLAGSDSRVNTPAINLYNALVQVKPGTTEVQPELAESFEASDDGTSYTFNLRQGVMFHDGTELTADDIKYTIDRMLALQTGTYRNLTAVTGAEVIDDYTVRIDLEAPFPALPEALTRLYILNADLVRENEVNSDWGQQWLQDHEAGSGPYALVSFQPEQQFTIERFPDYFLGWEDDHVDRAIFRVIKEESTRRLALQRGEVDWISLGSADTYTQLADEPGIETQSNVTLNQLYFAFNTTNEYLSDPRVRRALSMAYDYQGHAEQIRQGFADVARGPIPPAIVCHDESIPPSEYNLEAARQLMAEAGYPDGGFSLQMAYQGTAPEETAAMQLMSAGAAELGITIEPLAVEWPAKIDLFSSEDTAPGIGTIWIYPGYPDPDVYLYPLSHSSQAGQLNFAYYSNPRLDELLVAGKSELDPERRCEIYREAQQIWLEDMPYANVVQGHTLAAWRDYVKGYVASPSHALTVDVYQMSLDGKPER